MASKKIIGKRIQNIYLGAKRGYLKTVYKPGIGGLDEEVNEISVKMNNNSDFCKKQGEIAQKEKVKRIEEKKIAKIEKAKKRAERRKAIHDFLFEDGYEESDNLTYYLDDLILIDNSYFRDAKFVKFEKKLSFEDLKKRNYHTSPLFVFYNGGYYKVVKVEDPVMDYDNMVATVVVVTESQDLIFKINYKISTVLL